MDRQCLGRFKSPYYRFRKEYWETYSRNRRKDPW